jgi:hypothetical protein
MTRIQVETAKLEQLSRDLNLLRFEFEGIGDRVEDYRDAIGRSGRLADALDDVATNWSKKRGKIVDALQAFSDTALGAARHYEEHERQMAAGFQGGSPE